MNDEVPRKRGVGLHQAMERDIARRGLVGFHKTKEVTDQGGSLIDECAPPLKAFEYDMKAQTLTGDGSLIVAPGQREHTIILTAPEITVDTTGALPAGWPLDILPPGFLYYIYHMPTYMEAGKIIRMQLRARYPGGLAISAMQFYLCRKNPNDAAINNFVQEDILLKIPHMALLPVHTGTPFEQWALWYDKHTDIPFNYPLQAPASAQQSNAVITDLYIVMEQWNALPIPAGHQLRIDFLTEDRGR